MIPSFSSPYLRAFLRADALADEQHVLLDVGDAAAGGDLHHGDAQVDQRLIGVVAAGEAHARDEDHVGLQRGQLLGVGGHHVKLGQCRQLRLVPGGIGVHGQQLVRETQVGEHPGGGGGPTVCMSTS